MFIAKRTFLNSKRLTYCLSTSAANRSDNPGKESPASKEENKAQREPKKRREKLQYEGKVVSPEEKENAKNSLSALLKSLSVNNDQKQEDSDLSNMLKAQINKKQEKKQRRKNLVELLVEAAGTVAEDVGGDTKQTKKDLLDHLRAIEVTEESEAHEQLTVDRPRLRMGTADTLRALAEVFSAERLGIFEKSSAGESDAEVKLNIWERLEEAELAYLARRPPRNQVEEWILWTEQGKLWHFPIDNDQGMEREAEVEFTQHVFLDEHLEPWCPRKGPLKKFMDLVLVGLSKNPYLTVEEKKEHIFWYRDYFENKKKLLQELGAFGSTKEIGDSVSPQPEEKQ